MGSKPIPSTFLVRGGKEVFVDRDEILTVCSADCSLAHKLTMYAKFCTYKLSISFE